jgi:tRNA U34 2-thiouridine synthase MnmA/TrmU
MISANKKIKAVALLSGGLDSVLAIKVMLDLGVEVTALNFISWFCAGSIGQGKRHLPCRVAEKFGIPIRVLNMGPKFHRIIENPKYGHGKQINPCIDCKIFMLQKAKEVMDEIGAEFAITGEVLGQRPMSQRKDAMRSIENNSGLVGRILRPLSARLLEPTIVEQEGLIDREKLLDIQGRSRKRQYALAKELGIDLHGAPAGGCLLTDAIIARRLRDLFANLPDYSNIDARLLSLGRHFRLHKDLKVIIGRREAENNRLLKLTDNHGLLELANDLPGPVMLVRGQPKEDDLLNLGRLLRYYAKKVTDDQALIIYSYKGKQEEFTAPNNLSLLELDRWRI